MKKFYSVSIIICLSIVTGALYIFRPALAPQTTSVKKEVSMKFISSAFTDNGKIPVKYTCDGEKIHPPLFISGVPSSAKSLAIIIDDPDAPNGTFNHWVIWNIDPATKAIPEGSVPDKSQEGTNSAGIQGFIAPCPPNGQHRYFFTLYALDTPIGLDGKATKTVVEKSMAGHIMAQFILVGVYSR